MTQNNLLVTLATKNEGKRRELMQWVDQKSKNWVKSAVQLAIDPDAPEIDETGTSFLENARLKASQSPPVSGSDFILAEDSGLVVDALDGKYHISPFPGIYSNRWLTAAIRDELLSPENPVHEMPLDRVTSEGMRNGDLCQAILALLQDSPHRSARYCCGMALWHREDGLLFECVESTELWVVEGKPRGKNGFGYDPIMQPVAEDGRIDSRTVAELSVDEKNAMSHRGRAFQKVLNFLAMK